MPIPVFALLVAAAPLFAQEPADSRRVTPEQYPGQLARLRLAMLYPTPVPEPPHVAAREPHRRLELFLDESEAVLRNSEGLIAYLRAGLRDPLAVDGDRERWEAAWGRLEAETARLAPLAADGEALAKGPVPHQDRWRRGRKGYVRLEDAQEFPGDQGALLHHAAVLAAYVRNLRVYLLRKSAEPERESLAESGAFAFAGAAGVSPPDGKIEENGHER